MPCLFVSYEGIKKKKNIYYVDNYLSIALCVNLIRLYLDSPLPRLLDQGFVWRHPCPRCSLLHQQANGKKKKKVNFDIIKMVGDIYTKKQKSFLAPEQMER